jgi:hypothetical protein
MRAAQAAAANFLRILYLPSVETAVTGRASHFVRVDTRRREGAEGPLFLSRQRSF